MALPDAKKNGNYLRVRGEYPLTQRARGVGSELPPRARRIPIFHFGEQANIGTTSACAENTRGVSIMCKILGNYLRVRGEYKSPRNICKHDSELPPRARRIPVKKWFDKHPDGTTSAHAENTGRINFGVECLGNYLRARGEYNCGGEAWRLEWELPPRTRRILDSLVSKMEPIGTTSAHAENTYAHQWPPSPDQNYLRARGEYIAVLRSEELTMELPPRTRRIHALVEALGTHQGTTSAHAENTV